MGGEKTPICEEGGGGLLLPLSEAEVRWAKPARGVIYLLMLLYMFMAVNIAADFFMAAIERITSKKRRIQNAKTGRYVTVLVWNDTIANLTLMALGSSAPEILLSVIETMSNKFYSGELGPGTIVGSAAFNILVIVAVCVYSIPSPEIRKIDQMAVYHVTVLFSFFAYFWLLAIVQIISPHVVDIWEGVVTLLMFPCLVGVSFLADKGHMDFMSLERPAVVVVPEDSLGLPRPAQCRKSQLSQRHEDGSGAFHRQSTHPRLLNRTSSARPKEYTGPERRSQPGTVPETIHEVQLLGTRLSTNTHIGVEAQVKLPAGDTGYGICDARGRLIENPQGILTFLEDAVSHPGVSEKSELVVNILRRNGTSGNISCRYHTEPLTAVPGYDYEEVKRGRLEFLDGECARQISLGILAKRDWEKDDTFQLILEDAEGGVTFNPNDDGGKEHCVLTVAITNGTRSNNEQPDGCSNKCLACSEHMLDLDNLSAGFEAWTEQVREAFSVDGGDDDDEEEDDAGDAEGCRPSLLKESRPESRPSPLDYLMHIINFPWKLLFAIISPPPNLGGGWVLFVAALVYIACITAVINDLAGLFGCCAGMPNSVTAITVVALGTSLPDLFASQMSAKQDDNADASIVNVTGSNSVNVFLGIGIPWTCAAIHWKKAGATEEWQARYQADYPDLIKKHINGAFVIIGAEDLQFSVAVYVAVVTVAIVLLRARRLLIGGELGGPEHSKLGSSVVLVMLWVTYVGTSIWRATDKSAEAIKLPMAGLAVSSIIAGIVFEYIMRSARQRQPVSVRASRATKTHRMTQNNIRASVMAAAAAATADGVPVGSTTSQAAQATCRGVPCTIGRSTDLEVESGRMTADPNVEALSESSTREPDPPSVAPPRLPPYPQEGANAALAGARRPRDLARVLTEDGPTKAVKKEKSHKKEQKEKKDRPDNSATSSTRPHR